MNINFHHAGKMGDLIYALPAIRALCRMRNAKAHIVTSGLCAQIVPLLWEQPYIDSVFLDDTRPYKANGQIIDNWKYFEDFDVHRGVCFNLSPQPDFNAHDAPVYWTECYMRILGVAVLEEQDKVAFPSLVNHRRWMRANDVFYDGKLNAPEPTIIVAPESETLPMSNAYVWQNVINSLRKDFHIVVIGKTRLDTYWDCIDLRGCTTVPAMARLVADASGFIGHLSLPFHIARHSEVPSVCLQDMSGGVERSRPIESECLFIHPDDYMSAVTALKERVWRTSGQ